MYPVLKIMHMLNFLDTFSMGITGVKDVEVVDIKRGRVLVIGDVDPKILIEKLKNINKNAEICG